MILQNVKVLAVGKQLEIEEKNRGKALPVTVATLLVTPEQSEKLALAATQGKLLLTLRSWTDESRGRPPRAWPGRRCSRRRAAAPRRLAEAAKPAARTRRRSLAQDGEGGRRRPAPAASKHVVEILRGDRFEERKFEAKEKP